MKRLALNIFLLSAFHCGGASCTGIESSSFRDKEMAPQPARLLSAERHTAHWMHAVIDDRRGIWIEQTSWVASPVALRRLEKFLMQRSWISVSEFALDGRIQSSGRASCVRQWIDCSFSNGRTLRIFFSTRAPHWIVDGWSHDRGKFGFRLDISAAECLDLLDESEWWNPKTREAWDEPMPENDEVMDRFASHPGIAFHPILAQDPEGKEESMISAIRTTRVGAHSLSHGNAKGMDGFVVREASESTLRMLESAVFGLRRAALHYSFNGDIQPKGMERDPMERILCTMNDGQVFAIHISANDGAFYVVGEGSFRLSLTHDEASALLNPTGWVPFARNE